jgi:hypothetical protein
MLIQLSDIGVPHKAVQLPAGRREHIQKVGCLRRFRSLAPSKARTKGAGCQDGAGEVLTQLLAERASQYDLGIRQSFHNRMHLFVQTFTS